MKRFIKILFIFLATLCLIPLFMNKTYAKDLDRIKSYEITVDPNFNDGSLNIDIKLKWQVLDSSSEGPLTWIKVGIPNYYADNIKALSTNISKISYYKDNGSFIRLDLDGEYQAGSVLDLHFSFNQSRMYHIKDDYIYYDYNPGYFSSILVDECILRWNAKDVYQINNEGFKIENGYYTYKSGLKYNEYININLSYEKSKFVSIDPDKQYTDSYDPYFFVKVIVAVSILAAILLGYTVIKYLRRDPYKSQRGFYVYPRFSYYIPIYRNRYFTDGGVTKKGTPVNPPKNVGRGGSHGGGGCACACACACAGGGRAGCSMKDFYHTNLKSKNTLEALKAKDQD